MSNEHFPLGILVPMHEEVEQLLTEIETVQKIEYARRSFYLGTLEGKKVVLAQSGIGKVASSFTATLLIQHFSVKSIVLSGVAGGLGAAVQVGDLCIAKEAIQHDMDCRPLFAQFQIPHSGISHYPSDLQMTEGLEMAAQTFIRSDFDRFISRKVQQELGIEKPSLHRGLLVSGDQFIGAEVQLGKIMAEIPEALFVEMEGAAVAQVCHDMGIPHCSIRTISDKANDLAHVDFNKFLNEAAKIYTALIIKRFVEFLP
jgi:adenosylhomocysteine nucleosidase